MAREHDRKLSDANDRGSNTQPTPSLPAAAKYQRGILREQILHRWSEHLDQRVRCSQIVESLDRIHRPLLPSTADNYRRYVTTFLATLSDDMEQSGAAAIAQKIESYINDHARQNKGTARAIRSALIGQFLPWCIENSLLPADQPSISTVSLSRFEPIPSPVIQELPVSSENAIANKDLTNDASANRRERRCDFSRRLQINVSQRDLLIDLLVRDNAFSLHALASFTGENLKEADSGELSFRFSDRTLQLDTDATVRMRELLEIRQQGFVELGLRDSDRLPLFLSADGGALIVREHDSYPRRPISAEEAIDRALTLIEPLIREEIVTFGQARVMSTDELFTIGSIHTYVSAEIQAYLRVMQTSVLQFFCINPNGPRIAFPGADGDYLTADGD